MRDRNPGLNHGGGNKPQPYIPAGNGEKSGEYTDKPQMAIKQRKGIANCHIRNVGGRFHFYGSKLVGKVKRTFAWAYSHSIPIHGFPNSVIKKIAGGYVVTERYYNDKGEVYLDIDYTCHGGPKNHPYVPHIHRWEKTEDGDYRRKKWEVFQ